MCCRYACLKAAAAKRRARHADGSADDAVAMCSASPKIALKKQQRESEEEDAEAAIAEHEKDRSGLEGARRMRRKFGG